MPPCRKGKATTTSSSRHHNRPKGSPQALGHLLQRGLKAPGLKRLGNLLQLGKDWPWIVGPRFSKHIFPGTLAHGVLWVACSHPAWGSEAQHYSRIFLKNIRERYPEWPKISALRFFYAPHLFEGDEDSRPRQEPTQVRCSPSDLEGWIEPASFEAMPEGLHGALYRLALAVAQNSGQKS